MTLGEVTTKVCVCRLTLYGPGEGRKTHAEQHMHAKSAEIATTRAVALEWQAATS